ncbi:MAG: TraR/DksA C4-type zinc finger protein [Anaerolineales bacterium]|nr:TraR/DksA C4-type zinc finger protein [Anaerolineales bacterium]
MSPKLYDLLQQSSARHSHLCPRQVLGVRMGLAGLAALGLESPINRQTALIIIETDGCFADGIKVSTGAAIGHRTLRVNDYGKAAATFVDVKTERAIRVAPLLDIRQRASTFMPDEERHYFAQLEGYQIMPDEEMFHFQEVILQPSLEVLLSKPNMRVNCEYCGEEIMNEREVVVNGNTLCLACANQGYYLLKSASVEMCELVSGH